MIKKETRGAKNRGFYAIKKKESIDKIRQGAYNKGNS